VLEVKTDPEVPPLPPHISLQRARAFGSSSVKGDPDELGVASGLNGWSWSGTVA
jgi:pyruvate dehydrogenase (quinone)